MLPKHTPLAARKELSRKLHAAKAKKRLALGVDAETLRWRAMHPWTTFSDKCGPEIERIEAMNDTPRIQIIQNSTVPALVASGPGILSIHVFNATGAKQSAQLVPSYRGQLLGPIAFQVDSGVVDCREIAHGESDNFFYQFDDRFLRASFNLNHASIGFIAIATWIARKHASSVKKSPQDRVESASAIITELLARTAKCDCRESDEAVAAAMAWLHDNTP